MLQSINTAFVTSAAGQPASSGILENQLNRYQVQLADWCHCPGGKTAYGKKKIAELQNQADTTKAQLQKIETARTRQKDAAATVNNVGAVRAVGETRAVSTLGNLVDVTA